MLLHFSRSGAASLVTFERVFVALLFIIYAGLSFALFDAVSRRIIDWHPQVEKRPPG